MTLPTDRRIREIGRGVARALVDAVGQGAGRPLIVAVSGGADSSALLLLLADTRERHGWSPRAAHVDHMIQSSDVRERFIGAARTLAERVDLPIDIIEADAAGEAERSDDGLEAAARRVRYRALTELALARGAPVVAVAHTQDDQAETVLLHILRGSGLDGLSGMPRRRELSDGLTLARPALEVTRAETEAVCDAYGWRPVVDPSNAHTAFTRNRVRQALMPLLREFNPQVSERLAQMAQSVTVERELLDLIGRETLQQLIDDGGMVERRRFLALPGPLQQRALRALCQERGVALSAERTSAALQVIQHGHGVVELPGESRLRIARGKIDVQRGCPPPNTAC